MKKKITLLLVLVSLALQAQCWKQISAGNSFTMAIKNDGTLWGWGFNSSGQLGNGNATMSFSPIQIGTESNWKSVSTGDAHTIALKNDGSLWGWGFNSFGEAGSSNGTSGDGGSTAISTPTRIGSANNWESISTGNFHSVAIKSDGTLWAWGNNHYGQLGNNTTVAKEYNTPVQIGTDTNWSKVSAANAHNIALKADGSLWAWGNNVFNQLGDGTDTERLTPVQIGSATNWQSISAGFNHNLAIKSDGTLWAWGTNTNRQLGDGTNKTKADPTQIGTLTDWQTVDAGTYYSSAIKNDGTLWMWGINSWGQLGNGNKITQATPLQIATNASWSQVNTGFNHALAIKTDGSLSSWGRNFYGPLGNGTNTDTTTPVSISCTQSNLAVDTFVSNKKVFVYPNPATDSITIAFPNNSVIKNVKINDASGKEIIKIENSSQPINISKLSKGIYFISIDDGNSLMTSKFIKI